MKTKIITLSKSPVITSEENMQNFILFMQFPNLYLEILQSSHNIIKDYYTKNIINSSDEKTIENALLLVSGEQPHHEDLFPINSIYKRKNDGKKFTLQKDGLVLYGGIHPISNYQDTIEMFLFTNKYQRVEKDEKTVDKTSSVEEKQTQSEQLFPLNSIYQRKDDKKLFVLSQEGLVLLGGQYPTFNYQHSIKLLQSTKKYYKLNIDEVNSAIKTSTSSKKSNILKEGIKVLSKYKKIQQAVTLGSHLLGTHSDLAIDFGEVGTEATIEIATELGTDTATEVGGGIILEFLSSILE